MPINSCTFVGNLTRDPELKSLTSGTQVCEFAIAVNERAKENGEWVDRPNFFDIVVFGGQAENCAKFLAKGRQVAVAGRARFEKWESATGEKRSKVRFVAHDVQFIGGRDTPAGQPQDNGQSAWGNQPAAQSDFGAPPQPMPGMEPPPPPQTGPADDHIPF